MKDESPEFMKGIRVSNGSIKAYKISDKQYEIIINKYFFNIKYHSKRLMVDSIEDVEDYFVQAKFERKI